MIPLFNTEDFTKSKSKDLLPCECKHCKKPFFRTKHTIQRFMNVNHHTNGDYCSKQCQGIASKKGIKTNCINCNKEIFKLPKDIKKSKSKNLFCSRSCSASYNNSNKTTGTRRSKLEIYLENKLQELYPNLEFHFNGKDTIGSELDIYIPSLKLAFELNGVFHFEPIYGEKKLNQIKNNDNNKFQKCIENDISLCIIDTSSQTYFKEQTSIKFLNIITNVIKTK
jgi:hypothetical protein